MVETRKNAVEWGNGRRVGGLGSARSAGAVGGRFGEDFVDEGCVGVA